MKTKKILFLMFGVLFFASCSPHYSLKGNYPDNVHRIQTSTEESIVWDRLIDFFAHNGIPINVIDKSSGLIVTESMSLLNETTVETKTGELENPEAYVVAVPLKGGFMNTLKINNGRYNVTASWNVRIKTIENKTEISVNIINLKGMYENPATMYTSGSQVPVIVESTGVFEETMLDLLK